MKMESILKKLAMLTMLGAFVFGTGMMVGCEESNDAGDAIGDAMDDTGDAMGDAADDAKDGMEDMADDAKDGMEDAGDAIKDATN